MHTLPVDLPIIDRDVGELPSRLHASIEYSRGWFLEPWSTVLALLVKEMLMIRNYELRNEIRAPP